MPDFIPRDQQPEIIDWECEHRRCGVWAPMGGGKTGSTIESLNRLSLVEDVFPALVLAPLRVANSTWPAEIAKWDNFSHLRTSPIAYRRNPLTSATAKERLAALRTPAEVYTLPYGSLTWLVEVLDGKWPFRTVIADELTRLKSYRTRQGGANAHALGKVAHTEDSRFIGLTGTPSPNGLMDLWGQTWFIDKGERLGKSFSAFDQRWFRIGYDGYERTPFPHAEAEIHGLLRDVYLTVQGPPVDEPVVSPVYVDLDPKSRELYRQMERHFFAEIEEHGIEAVNAAVRSSKCLAEGTEVLTARGWAPIESISTADILWDGVEWVNCDGVVCQGYKCVVPTWGVDMTPDHKVLTHKGWQEAQEIIRVQSTDRPYRPDVRLPHSDRPCWQQASGPQQECQSGVALSLRLREGNNSPEPVSTRSASRRDEVVRMQTRRDAGRASRYARADLPSGLGGLGWNKIKMPQPRRQGFPQLRRTRDICLRALAQIFRELLGGHESNLSARSDNRASRQQRALLTGKLPLADVPSASQQQAQQCPHSDAYGEPYGRAGSTTLRDQCSHDISENQKRVAGSSIIGSTGVKRVYDIVNVGPRQRFTVRGAQGEIFIVHNCRQIAAGFMFDNDDDWHAVHGLKLEALESIVEEANGMPVLVQYDFIPDRERILKHFRQARFLDADPKTEAAWNKGQIPILVAHGASAGHGLNLQDGGNILARYSYDWNLEYFMQIIERIGPLRQKQSGHERPVFDYPIIARGTIDETVIERHASKRSVQDLLLEAMRRNRED